MADHLDRIIAAPVVGRIVDTGIVEIGQFGHVLADIGRCVELLALRERRHDPYEHIAVDPGATDPLPIDAVVAVIGIYQAVPVPLLAEAPVDQQMLHQKAGADHPYAVVHPAGLPQLSHAGIDNGIAGHALLPAFEVLRDQMPRIGVPPQRALVIIAVALRGVIGELVDHVLRVIAPDHFLGVGLPAVRALVLQLVPDLRRADLAPMQMRGQARGDVLGRQVTPLVVLGNHIAPPFEPIMRGPLAEFPEVADAPGPVGLGRKQVPVGQFVAFGPAVGRMDRLRFG